MASLPTSLRARLRRQIDAVRRPVPMTVSIVLPVYDPPVAALHKQLAAIAAQTHVHWQCIVVDDASPSPQIAPILEAWVAGDDRRTMVRRARNGGIAAATNEGLDRVTGDVIVLCDHDDVIAPIALERIVDHLERHPEHDVVYTDEQIIDSTGRVLHVHSKPGFSAHRLLGHNYLAHLTAIRTSAVGTARVRGEFEPAQDNDFFLRVTEQVEANGRGVGHIAEVLYSWRAVAGSSALDIGEKPGMVEAVVGSTAAALERRGANATVEPVLIDGTATTAVQLRVPPSAKTVDYVEIDAASDPRDIGARLAASTADTVCLGPPGESDGGWFRPLVDYLALSGIGAIGPKLVAPDGTLISNGRSVALRLHDPFRGEPADIPGPWGVFLVTREVSALAPLGLVLDRRAVESVGGMSGDVGLDAAIVELCTKLRAAGHAVLATPTVELVCPADAVADVQYDDRVDDDLSVVSNRVPAVRTENFAPTGEAPLVAAEPPAVTQLRRLIAGGAVQLVTTDVFDTIVDRQVSTPSDVFVTLGRHLVDGGLVPSHVTPALFAEARIHAERITRQRLSDDARQRHVGLTEQELAVHPDVVAPECTLDEIWAAMPASWLGDAPRDELIEAELTNESAHLIPIAPTIEVLCLAADRGIIVHLVSDIYLSADRLRAVLRAAGVDARLLAHISTSADHRLGKTHGLLRGVIEAHGIAPRDTVHVGDNPIADVETATRVGAKAIAVDVLPVHHQVVMPPTGIAERSRALGFDGGIRSATRAVLLGAGSLGHDPSFQFGAAIAGPAITGFARWVATTAERLGATTVHCMLREGATIAELMRVVAPDGPAPVLLHASRWVNMRAAVIEGTPEELLTALARRAKLTPAHVANAFGCDATRVAEVIGADEIPHSHLPQACRRLAADDELRSEIVAAAAELRHRVLAYLREHLVVDDGPIVLADVGWGGTIQEGLTRILRSAGIDNEVIGLYFALSTPGEERLRSGARMLAYLPTSADDVAASRTSRIVSHNAEIIERILTPQLGTLIDVAADGTPVCRPDDDDHIPPTLRSAQRALRLTAHRLVAQRGGIDDAFFVDDLATRHTLGAAIADVIEHPTEAVAAALGSWPHDDVAGTEHRSISSEGIATAVRFANAYDIDVVDDSATAWINGVAALHNPVLVAQLSAAAQGVHPAALNPENRNGRSSLAVFRHGSDLAVLEDARVTRTGPNGWSVARVEGPVGSLRAVQFAPGTGSAVVQLGAFEIRVTSENGDVHHLDIDDLTDPRLQWTRAHPTGRDRLAHRAGGQFVLPFEDAIGNSARRVEITVGFRSWVLDPDDPAVRPPVRRTARTWIHRAAGAAARRLRR